MAAERAVRDRAATRALILGLLGLWFGLFAPFAVWSGAHSLWRIRVSDGALSGARSAAVGLIAGLIGLAFLVLGAVYWFLAS
jgi:hypothetical protein